MQFGAGWISLVRNLYEELRQAGWDENFSCVKEKFGRLEFYIRPYNDELEEIIERYQKLSIKTCDVCGEPGRLIVFSAICARHYLANRYVLQQSLLKNKTLRPCAVCGYVSVLEKQCTCCINYEWDKHYGSSQKEFYKYKQLDWYSYIKGIEIELISPLPKSPEHVLLFSPEELEEYIYDDEF